MRVRNSRSSGVIGGILIALVVIIYLLVSPARTEQQTTVLLASPTVAPTAATSPPATTQPPSATPTPSPSAAATPIGQYVNSTYKFSVILPVPYRKSSRVSMVFAGGTRPAAQDAFTARTDQDEASIDTSGCHTACPLWQYVAYVIVNTGTGTETPREYYAKQGGSVGQVIEDTTVDGRTAIKVTNGVPFPMQFIVKDGDRLFVVAYQIYPPENGMAIPAGATKDKLDAILASFKFVP
jgi:hypothetical protein